MIEYKYTPITMAVGRKSTKGDGFRFVGLVTKAAKEMWFKAKLPVGTYIAYVSFFKSVL